MEPQDLADCGPYVTTAPSGLGPTQCWAPSQLPCQPLAHPQCPSPLPGLAASSSYRSDDKTALGSALASVGTWMPRSSLGPCCPRQSQSHPMGLSVRESPGRQGLHLQAWVCLVALTLQPRSWALAPSSLQSPGPQLPSGRSSTELLEFDQAPNMASLTEKRTEGKLSLSGALFALSCFRRATQFPLEPLTP